MAKRIFRIMKITVESSIKFTSVFFADRFSITKSRSVLERTKLLIWCFFFPYVKEKMLWTSKKPSNYIIENE
ncbi:hypothetical protein EGQ50_00620 [Coxiella endosymbiont of Amblyomma sculptum]|nr:hypothetical protein EGQ50_00620 [Coxiella endosymbiont of Amblyomma sculptum]